MRTKALLAIVLAECLVFAITAPHFATAANAFEVFRLAVEVGLLALVMTPIIISGGIDLSVGSMMGLSAVVLGALWRDVGLSVPLAIVGALAVGLSGGLVNAVMIARLGLPPLIVTLGTFSLFRGIAEGITRGVASYSGWPAWFLRFGEGGQLWIFGASVLLCAWWVHLTAGGRMLFAIGHGEEGARYAGIPVRRRLAGLYLLSGVAAALAGIIYVAHLGQAKSDAGTGYELTAITAAVLGGASVTGGRGSVPGTVLALLGLVILQNGLQLAAQPAELAGILTGGLLVGAVVLEGVRWGRTRVAVFGVVAASAAAVVVAAHAMVPSAATPPGSRRLVIAMMPKAKGDPYFVSARAGAERAAQTLGVDLLWDGPTELDPAKQNEVVEAWITRRVDAIAVSVENKEAISTVLRKARSRGITVVTWDADAERDARDFFVNQATPQGIGYTLTDEAARVIGGNGAGQVAIITASLSAANQNEWIRYIKERIAARYPKMDVVAIQPSEGDRIRAFAETQTVLAVHPAVKVIIAIATPAVPGAAEAVKQSGRTDVKVVGLSLPNLCRPYIKEGVVASIVLWNTTDLGALTVRAAAAASEGRLKLGDRVLDGGPLGPIEVDSDEVMLGKPFVFTSSNIDRFNF